MFKTKKAQSIAKEYVVYIILGIMVLALVGVLWSNYGRPVWSQLMSIKGMNVTSESELGLTPFQIFLQEYKQCKMLPDDNCLCPFSQFNLPNNGFIELKNEKDFTAFNYYKGITVDEGFIDEKLSNADDIKYEALLNGCNNPVVPPNEVNPNCTKDSSFTVSGNFLIPMQPSNDYIAAETINKMTVMRFDKTGHTEAAVVNVEKGSIDTSYYVPDTKIFLVQSRKDSNDYTPIYVYTKNINLIGVDKFLFYRLYKKDNIHLLPFNSKEKSAELEKKVLVCVIPNDFAKSLSVLEQFNKKLVACHNQQVQLGKEVACEPIYNLQIPLDYKMEMARGYLSLYYKDKIIKSYSLESLPILIYSLETPKGMKINWVSNTITFQNDQKKSKNAIEYSEKKKATDLTKMSLYNIETFELSKCQGGYVCITPAETAKSLAETAAGIEAIAKGMQKQT